MEFSFIAFAKICVKNDLYFGFDLDDQIMMLEGMRVLQVLNGSLIIKLNNISYVRSIISN